MGMDMVMVIHINAKGFAFDMSWGGGGGGVPGGERGGEEGGARTGRLTIGW